MFLFDSRNESLQALTTKVLVWHQMFGVLALQW